MLFGESTSGSSAVTLLNQAAESGVNFFDTAEMYPVPQRLETQGKSEEILGSWMRTKRREELIIATKVTGPSGQMTWIRNGPTALDAPAITAAIDGSLQRLNTDYIDLYQLHWPDRYVPMFGETRYHPEIAYSSVPLEEQLEALAAAQRAGKIRHIGLSNETPWGLMEFCRLAKARDDLPRVASLQNAYSLLCRTFEGALAECCHQERVFLLAYSPLAMGLLTGKYIGGGSEGARLNKYKGRYAEAESRYGPKPNTAAAVEAYVALAHAAAISPTELAIRFVLSNTLVASAIVGATSSQQLQELLDAAEKGPLSEDLLAAVDDIHQRFPNPNP
ncbi:Aldo/keto reductase [Coccomyxa subellipsoidea C-169]|uniref:Aldo/keto reductase n=1 Tax=Coccomyxa subellipsoidea (strain C-169) TaxID=574566 RepID=I0Z0Q5_COCSC|nr:Aldo/keto reductase [Coccomyxa subellipsoidea C-169]EIE24224.1 Aldo/keto reductase [Coccomyxa subellipsoidea C-169]|eukprot:XP_005648768.1 Aldo/keto reductase [Coccomyxa subellipsoidea C-169]